MRDPRPAGNQRRLKTTCPLPSWLCFGSEPAWETGPAGEGLQGPGRLPAHPPATPFWHTWCISGCTGGTLQLMLRAPLLFFFFNDQVVLIFKLVSYTWEILPVYILARDCT